ncbi:Leukotriene A-4 hydrolase, partial [Cladochytrium tenue]
DPSSYANTHEVVVKHADIDLKVDFDSKTLSGTVHLTAEVVASSVDTIVLDANKLNIGSVQVDGHPAKVPSSLRALMSAVPIKEEVVEGSKICYFSQKIAIPEHFWLNEGFTKCVERKIISRMHGEAHRHFSAIIGEKALRESIKEFEKAGRPEFTHLCPKLVDVDPDDVFSSVPYEKGFHLLFYLEQILGGPDAFDHIQKFSHKSITTKEFKENLYIFFSAKKAVLDSVDWDAWFHKPGMPPVKNEFDRTLAAECDALAKRWDSHRNTSPSELKATFAREDFEAFSSNQKVVFLEQLLDRDPFPVVTLDAMEEIYGLVGLRNCEVRCRWDQLCLRADRDAIFADVVNFVTTMGRMKYVRPLYRSVFQPPRHAHVADADAAAVVEGPGDIAGEGGNDDDDDDDVRPQPGSEAHDAAAHPKERKRTRVLPHDELYLSHLPSADLYERSLMHHDVVNLVAVTRTDFFITTSVDKHVKFWKKTDRGIEFVKHFRAHLGPWLWPRRMTARCWPRLARTRPSRFSTQSAVYNPAAETVVSVDAGEMIEYWRPEIDLGFPAPKQPSVSWEFKSETDLYEFKKEVRQIVASGRDGNLHSGRHGVRRRLALERDIKRAKGGQSATVNAGRDVFNEKPSREEQTGAAMSSIALKAQLGSQALIHTSVGDIHLRLFPEHAPKAVKNFVGLAKKGKAPRADQDHEH